MISTRAMLIFTFQRSDVRLPEFGFPLDGLVPADHVQMLFQHFGSLAADLLRLRRKFIYFFYSKTDGFLRTENIHKRVPFVR